jgi:glycosyltransferase involved in cell wall biosynthesis
MARTGNKVSIISFIDPEQPQIEETPLAALCETAIGIPAPGRETRDRLRDLISGQADLATRRWSEAFAATLRDLIRQQTFDIIQIEGLEMAPYLDVIRPNRKDAVLVYDAHNAEHALQKRIAHQDSTSLKRMPYAVYSSVQTMHLTRLERRACDHTDLVIACSEADAAHLRGLGIQTPVEVISNAIYTRQYRLAGRPDASIVRPSLVFTGKMDFRPNVDAALWFTDEVLPLIRKEIPQTHFTIVGKNPHARLEALAGRAGVTLTGFVPDVQPYIRAADVFVAPLRMGSGTRFKLLEAMAMSRAIVSTTLGAEGLEVQNKYHLYLADSPQDFADAVLLLLQDENWRLEIGFNAAKLVRDNYDWPVIIPQIQEIYDETYRAKMGKPSPATEPAS